MKSMNLKLEFSGTVQKIVLALAGGIALFVLVLSVGTMSFRGVYRGRIFPGIYLGWINLSGQTPTDAAGLLAEDISYPETGEITLQYDDLSWEASPSDLGLFFSPNFNAEQAFAAGRTGGIARRIADQIKILRHGEVLTPKLVLD